jgi:hypothetical protein
MTPELIEWITAVYQILNRLTKCIEELENKIKELEKK